MTTGATPPAAACGLLPGGASFTLWSRRVVTPQGVLSAAVAVEAGVIRSVTLAAAAPPGAVDYGNLVVSPARARLPSNSWRLRRRLAILCCICFELHLVCAAPMFWL